METRRKKKADAQANFHHRLRQKIESYKRVNASHACAPRMYCVGEESAALRVW
jgi:hypothetical protein